MLKEVMLAHGCFVFRVSIRVTAKIIGFKTSELIKTLTINSVE